MFPHAVSEEPVPATEEAGSNAPRSWVGALRVASAFVPGIVAVGLLVLAAVSGMYVRPAADDWCSVSQMRVGGIAGLIHHDYAVGNGRAANGLAQGVVWSDGLLGAELLPGVLALSLALGSFFVLRAAVTWLGWRVPGAALGSAVAVAVALTFFAGTVVYQVVYWPAGSLTHTLPVALGVLTVAVAIVAGRSRRVWAKPVALVLGGVIGFGIGTLSEPFVAVSAVYVFAFGVCWFLRARRNGHWYPVLWATAWLVGLAAGFEVLLRSPGLAVRTARPLNQAPLYSIQGIHETLHGWKGTWLQILDTPAYYGALAIGLAVGLLASRRVDGTGPLSNLSRRSGVALLVLPLVLVIVSSLAVIAGLREGYGLHGWLYERAWTNFLFPALLTAVFYGAVAGVLLRPVLGRAGRQAVPVALVLAAVAGTVAIGSLVPRSWHLTEAMAARAPLWDANNAAVERQVRSGAQVVVFTPHRIAHSTEPFTLPRSRDWVAGCVAVYYGVRRIVPPG